MADLVTPTHPVCVAAAARHESVESNTVQNVQRVLKHPRNIAFP